VCPPKTASTSLHRFFSQKPFRDQIYKPQQEKNQHDMDIPDRCKKYGILTCWRDPLDRELSLWKHSQGKWERENGVPKLTFEEFVRDWQPISPKPFFKDRQVDYLRRLPKWAKITCLFRFDKLGKQIPNCRPVRQAIKNGFELEHLLNLNQTKHGSVEWHYTKELKEIVRERFADDYLIKVHVHGKS